MVETLDRRAVVVTRASLHLVDRTQADVLQDQHLRLLQGHVPVEKWLEAVSRYLLKRNR